jgi:hypothetical protein
MRHIIIPAAILPGTDAEHSRAEIALTLVDRAGDPLPASLVTNAALYVGTKRFTVGAEPLTIPIATQAEINGQSWYQVVVRQGTATWQRRVQVPGGHGDLTWAEFTAIGDPVTPPPSRLLPDPATLDDGQWVTSLGHAWVTTDAPPGSGIADSPRTGGPYGRQASAWVDLSSFTMSPLIYDPRGVRADIFSAEHLTGAIDGGTF